MDVILLTIVIILSAIVFHEYGHAWMAYKCGDPTAKLAGRLTLNPIKHLDLIGSFVLPATLIVLRIMGLPVVPVGWAKPVPVDFGRLNNPKRDMIWVGMAGPAINVVIAILCSRLLLVDMPIKYFEMVYFAIFINLLLAVFNMIPIPPLDGSRLVMGLLPNRLAFQYSRLERYGILIVIGLLFLGMFDYVVWPVLVYCGKLLGVNFSEIG